MAMALDSSQVSLARDRKESHRCGDNYPASIHLLVTNHCVAEVSYNSIASSIGIIGEVLTHAFFSPARCLIRGYVLINHDASSCTI